MKLHIKLSIIFVSVICSCKMVQVNRPQPNLTPPTQYTSTTALDSASIAYQPWRLFFTDSNLLQLIDTVLHRNFDLQIALQKSLQVQAGVLSAEGDLRPTAGPAVNGSLRRFGLYTMDGAGNITTEITPGKIVPIHLPDFFVGFQSSWEVDLWGKLRHRKKAVTNRFLGSLEGIKLVQTTLVNATAATYYELQILDARIRELDQYIRLQQEALEIVKIQKEAGAANELAIKQFEARLNELLGMRSALRQSVLEAENAIHFLTGSFQRPVQRTPFLMEATLPGILATGLPIQLLENRPDVRTTALELAAAGADLNAARAQFYPSLNLGAMIGTQAFRPDFLITKPTSFAYNVAGGLAAPLLNRRALKAAFNYADAYRSEAALAFQQSILNAYLEVSNQINLWENLKDQYGLKLDQAKAVEAAVEISSELFKTGRAGYLDILAAQQNALEARFELLDIRLQQWLTLTHTYRALGGGWR